MNIGLTCVSVMFLSNSNFQNVTSGMFSGACSAVVVVPADRIKCLLQVKNINSCHQQLLTNANLAILLTVHINCKY